MKQLLFSVSRKDLRIETYRGSGKGGQHRNKTDSAVRITHLESGAVAHSEDERSQHQNKKKAFERLVNTKEFQLWHKKKAAEVMGVIKTPEQIAKEVDEAMAKENLKIEVMENGKWIEKGEG